MSFLAFQIVTASRLNAEIGKWAPFIARRTSDLSLITNTLTNDAQMFIAGLPASTVMRLDSAIGYKGSQTGDFKIQWTCSGSGSSLFWNQGGLDSGATTSQGADFHGQITLSDNAVYGAINASTSPQLARPSGYLFTGTGSNITLQLQWCQGGVDGVNGSSILTGSTMELTPKG